MVVSMILATKTLCQGFDFVFCLDVQPYLFVIYRCCSKMLYPCQNFLRLDSYSVTVEILIMLSMSGKADVIFEGKPGLTRIQILA